MADALDIVEWAAAQLPAGAHRPSLQPPSSLAAMASCMPRAGAGSRPAPTCRPPTRSPRCCLRCAGPDRRVVVVGYSWGSCVGAHALAHPSVAAYVGVSPPLGGLAWVLQTKKHFGEVLRATHVPRLLLLGDQARLGGGPVGARLRQCGGDSMAPRAGQLAQTSKHVARPLPLASDLSSQQDQFTSVAALQALALASGGALLRQDDSYLSEASPPGAAASAPAAAGATAAAAEAAGAAGGSGSGLPGALPGAEQRELLLRVWADSDHFWLSHHNAAATYVVRWLEGLLQAQQQRRSSTTTAGSQAAAAAAAAAQSDGTEVAAAGEG